MKSLLIGSALLATILAPAVALSQTSQMKGDQGFDPRQYVLFLHTGPLDPTDIKVTQLASALARRGYLVRSPDGQADEVGGPGVDYFVDADAKAAADVAATVNATLPDLGIAADDTNKLAPRRQTAKNSPGYLGVWLFRVPQIDLRTWPTAPPSVAWCYQENHRADGKPGFQANCHWSRERCLTARGKARWDQTDCVLVTNLGGAWQPSAGGYMGAWYQSSDQAFPSPLPQLPPH